MCFMFPPAEKAEPAPVKITARTALSCSISWQISTNSSIWLVSESAFRCSGRFMVKVTTPSRFSYVRNLFIVIFAGFGLLENSENDSMRSEEHTSELQSLMRISYAVFCLKKNKKKTTRKE